jgi:hypothetical protein
MHRLIAVGSCLALFTVCGALAVGCGGKKDADDPKKKHHTDGGGGDNEGESSDGDGGTAEGDGGPKADVCVGFDVASMDDMLSKAPCEVPNQRPDSIEPKDMKGKIEVKVDASPTSTAPGGKIDLLVSILNKTKEPITLNFRIDPTPRFDVEALDKKGKRVDMPAGTPPSPKTGESQPPPSDPKTAKLTIAAGGSARQRVTWEAVKTAWAPEKVKGWPVEKGFPRKPAGPIAKGKYTIKVQTPLVGVAEGAEHEISAPKVEIEVK